MCKKEIQCFILLCLVLAGYANLTAQEKTIIIGGKEGWPQLSVSENIVSGKGRYGYEAKMLSTNEKKLMQDTDLLLNFESDAMSDEAGNYSIVSNGLSLSSKSTMGKGAGLSYGTKGLVLKGRPSSLFGSSGYKGSLTISFWLYPVLAESGEIIFSWRSSRNSLIYSTYQNITASFFNGKMEWRFTNVFTNEHEIEKEIVLTSQSTIIPNTWSHHSLVYNEDDGTLEYYINGSIEVITYATESLSYSPDVLRLVLGVPADIVLCQKYSGLIDDFSILSAAQEIPDSFDAFCSGGGRFVTQPLDTGKFASVMNSLNAEVTLPSQTGIQFFARAGDNFYEWNESRPQWIPVKQGEKIQGITGRYFQITAMLYPDGTAKTTPSVTEIRVSYSEAPVPLPPYLVRAEAGDSYVDLSWSPSVDASIGGYFVYYGERPGEYLGRAAVQGNSPIQAGNVNKIRLTGLVNGKIYYFAVAAYSAHDERIRGSLSKEVYARPLKE